MKALVAAFNQEEALASRGLLRDYEPSDGTSFESLIVDALSARNFISIKIPLERCDQLQTGGQILVEDHKNICVFV